MSWTWGASSTDANISASTIAASSALASAAVDNSGKAGTEVGLTLTYNASATAGAKIEVLRTTDGGTTYQADADSPFAFSAPFTAGGTYKIVFTVPAAISNFKVNVVNLDTAQSITAVTMKSRQATS